MSLWNGAALALTALVAYALVFWLVADVAWRLSARALRRAAMGAGRVALTFDDGPGPETAAVLDSLKEHGAHATFFVVWQRARREPALLARMLAEGHDIALHGARHVHAALWWPWQAGRELRRAAAELSALTGGRALPFFRPPWGAMSAALAMACRRAGLRVVLWSVDGRDYRADMTAATIAARVVGATRDGDIVDVHDHGGAEGAPARTRAALAQMVAGLRGRGLEPVTLSELLGAGEEPVTLGLRLWELWEELFKRLEHEVPVGSMGLIAISTRPYRGPVLHAPDGSAIVPGTPAGEIHLGNFAVSRMAGGMRETLRVRRLLNEAMDVLAAEVADGAFPGVQVFFGTTLLGRAAAQVGLHAEAVAPTLGVRANTAYMRLLMRIYHPDGGERLRRHPGSLVPMLCWVTRQELMARAATRRAAAAARAEGAPTL